MTTETSLAHGGAGGLEEPTSPRRWQALALLSVAQFMLILDVTVVAIALPDIGADLGLDRASLTWVVTAYTLMFGGLMLLGGRAADLFGARRMVLVGLATFTVASGISGVATGPAMLITGRVLQGAGAAILSPAALSLVTTGFHGAERHRALGVWAALGGVGSAAGVLLGGLLTAGPGWPWIFYVNLPIGLALLATLPMVVPAGSRTQRAGRRVDVPGAVLVTVATAVAIYALTGAGDRGWTSSATWWPLAGAAVLYAGFLAYQRRVGSPLMDVRVLARRPVLAGGFLMLIATGLLIASFFLGSFYAQRAGGHSAAMTGVLFLPVAVATVVGAHSGGRLVARLGPRWLAVAALAVVALGAAVPAVVTGTTAMITGISVAALGLGATIVAATTTALADVAPHEAGITSGIVNTWHEFGAALGVAAISSVAGASIAVAGAGTAGFPRAFTVSAVIAALSALVALPLVPRGKPAPGRVPHAH